jgi:NADPH-dependent 2,4-dienoyl-CoA reductase/sulfur reductase-like enzyme
VAAAGPGDVSMDGAPDLPWRLRGRVEAELASSPLSERIDSRPAERIDPRPAERIDRDRIDRWRAVFDYDKIILS